MSAIPEDRSATAVTQAERDAAYEQARREAMKRHPAGKGRK